MENSMYDVKVSVIVPVYKVEKYLDRCVQSILTQDYKNLDIILVDDGSPDNCPKMCDEYAAKDSRVKAVHKANGGLPDARNAGLAVATGDYIMFVDSDDLIEQNTVTELLKIIHGKDYDFVTFGAVWDGRKNVPDGTPCQYEDSRELKTGHYDEKRIKEEIYPRMIITSDLYMGPILPVWSSIYSKKFLDDNSIKFDPEIKYTEDAVFSMKTVHQAKSFFVTDKYFYHYCFNGESISNAFHGDLWAVEKLRHRYMSDYLANSPKYDFSIQLKLTAIFCVIAPLYEFKKFETKKEQLAYIRSVFNDQFTVDAMKNIKYARVPLKKKLYLLIIKYKMARLYRFLFK